MHLKFLVIACVALGLAGCSGGSGGTMKEVVDMSHPNGKPKKVNYFKGKTTNPCRTVFYYEDGKLQSDQWFNAEGKPDSMKVIYAPNGQKIKETFYTATLLNGTDKSWYEDGKPKSEASYVNGAPQSSVSYHPNGQKSYECSFKDGKKEGLEITYDSTGKKLHLVTFVAGDRTGIEQTWFPGGSLKEEKNWTKDILNGPFVMYHKNGKKNEEGSYTNGKLEGKRFMYNEKGRKISEATFEHGVLMEGESF